MQNNDQKNAIDAVKRYIDRHLMQKMSLFELAKVSGYSPWYLSRIFKQACEKTLFEYIRSQRLSRAAVALRESGPKVIDVALDFIFDTHEGFSRAFAREFGVSPKAYSRLSPYARVMLPYPSTEKTQKGDAPMNQDVNIVFAQVIERPKRKAIIKRGKNASEYFQYCEEAGCDVWEKLCAIKGALFEPMGMWLPKKLIPPGTSSYVQGVEVPEDYAGDIPEGFELIELEPTMHMIFQGRKYDDADFENEVLAVMRAIDGYDPGDFGFVWADEKAPRFQYAPKGDRGYIEGRPVEPV